MSGNAESPATVEQKKRYEQALKDIEELKKKHPHATFSMKTPFALMTETEFQEYVNRNNINPKDLPLPARNETGVRPQHGSPDAGPSTRAAQPGESVDWSNSNCVGEVRDQAQCGACWAFSAAAAIESGLCVHTNGYLPKLSDQQPISCDAQSSGCGGGYASLTMDWVAKSKGGKMCTLESFPFSSGSGSVPACRACNEIDVGVTGFEAIRNDPGAQEDRVRERPLNVFMWSGSRAFQYYSGGILTGDNCDKTGAHSALLVGFGEENGMPFWRIRNQWGSSWGEKGYIRIQRRYGADKDGACGIESYASWPTFRADFKPPQTPGVAPLPAPTQAPAPEPQPQPQPQPAPVPQPEPTPVPAPIPQPQPQPQPAPEPVPHPQPTSAPVPATSAPQPNPEAAPTRKPEPAPTPKPEPAPKPATPSPAQQQRDVDASEKGVGGTDDRPQVGFDINAKKKQATCGRMDEGVDYLGNDLKDMAAGNAGECCKLCQDTPGCNAFTFSNWKGGYCWLKTRAGIVVPNAGAVSSSLQDLSKATHQFTPLEVSYNYPGNDITEVAADAADKCYDLCLNDEKCHAFTFKDGKCALKTRKPSKSELVSDKSVASGIVYKCKNLEANVDFEGDDLRKEFAQSPESCCAICRQTEGCKAFSWSDFKSGTCWLKSGSGKIVAKGGVVSASL
ncbi:hypothetical protein PINS_up002816 [Pythium insidiosum]|nr:hypothetical protein PINS_up002816 [Pythium insidiosum]